MTKTWFNASTTSRATIAAVGLMLLGGPAMSAGDNAAPEGRKIAYVLTETRWGLYQTKDGKEECPTGMNDLGPREQFKLQFPADGTKRTIVETQLSREADVWWPKMEKDRFPFHEAAGTVAVGLDLDGKTKPTDFKSPEGKPGIDNQMFRVIGCTVNFRDGSSVQNFEDIYHKKMMINRMMIVITDVDSLTNDDDVTVTTYRGLDPMVADAAGQDFFPGGTERLDLRWGKEFIHSAKAKIVNGVLISTQGLDYYLPHEVAYMSAAYYWFRDARFELSLTPGHAQGLIGGYADINHFYRSRNREWSTHHLSYGQESMANEYRALKRYADAYPDAQTGENTAISAAFRVKMAQVRIIPDIPPAVKVAGNE